MEHREGQGITFWVEQGQDGLATQGRDALATAADPAPLLFRLFSFPRLRGDDISFGSQLVWLRPEAALGRSPISWHNVGFYETYKRHKASIY